MTGAPRVLVVLVVEGDTPFPKDLYCLLGGLGVEVLGPVNNALDTVRLARDRHPEIAILDGCMDVGLLHDLHGILPALGVHCLDVCIRDGEAAGADGIGGIDRGLTQFSGIDREGSGAVW